MKFWTGSFCETRPVTAIALCVLPWNPPWNATISPRPVAVLHSFSAASTAFAPAGPQNWIFISLRISAGSSESWSSVNSSLSSVGKSRPWHSVRSWRSTASTHSGSLCPSARTPAPVRKSMNTFPSTSSMYEPAARAIPIGKRRGYVLAFDSRSAWRSSSRADCGPGIAVTTRGCVPIMPRRPRDRVRARGCPTSAPSRRGSCAGR